MTVYDLDMAEVKSWALQITDGLVKLGLSKLLFKFKSLVNVDLVILLHKNVH